MPEDVIASPDRDALAGEFVLGTLDAHERAAAHELISSDADFAAKVKVWERRLGELHLMVEPIEPEPQVWERIKARLPAPALSPAPEPASPEPQPQDAQVTQDKQDTQDTQDAEVQESGPELKLREFKFDLDFLNDKPTAEPELAPAPALAPKPEDAAADKLIEPGVPDVIALPSAEATSPEPAAPEAPVVQPPPEPPPAAQPASFPPFIAPKPRPPAAAPPTAEIERKVRSLRRHLAGWRAFAAVMALALIALAALVAVWRYAPERVPPQLRPVELMRFAGISVEAPLRPKKPLPPESQFDE